MSRWLHGDPVRVGGPWWRSSWRFRLGAAYEIGATGSGWIVTIPAGFVFDLSAPWWIAWALPRARMRRAAGLHDFARTDPAWSLWFGDLLFPDALKVDGVREPILSLAWWAVRTNDNRA